MCTTKKADAKNAAQRGDTGNAWRRMVLRSLREHAERVTHSIGQVQQFLTRTPCLRLDRMLVPSLTEAGTSP